MKYIIFICIILCSCSCSDNKRTQFLNKEVTSITFTKTKEIIGTKVGISNFGAHDFNIVDTFIVFNTPQLDTLYSISSLNSFQHIGNYVSKGGGDNERISALSPMFFMDNTEESVVVQYDHGRRYSEMLNITKMVETNYPDFEKYSVNLSKIDNLHKFYPLCDTSYFIDYLNTVDLSQHHAIIRKADGEIIKDEKAIISNIISLSNSYLLAAYTCFSKNKAKYVRAMTFIDQIDIYDINNPSNSVSRSTSTDKVSLDKVETIPMPDRIEYYGSLRLTDSYIFALYINQNRKDWALEDTPATIQIFDWSGNPVVELKTKEKIKFFDIDVINHRLLGMTDDETFYSYDISDLF